MLRITILLLLFLVVSVNSVAAQVPGIPPGSAAEAPPAAGGNSVTITNKCCSIWDKLGVVELGEFVGGIFKLPLFQFIGGKMFGPVASIVGLDPHDPAANIANGGTAGGSAAGGAGGAAAGGAGAGGAGGAPPSAGATAGALAAKKKAVKAKVAAIRFLANENCLCYPEIVDSLLAALDDCAEEVRYEALKALRKGCGSRGCLSCSTGNCDPRTDANCPNCQCQTKVLVRLSDLLLDRDIHNQYKERSQRVRQLAAAMISQCLQQRPVNWPGEPQRESRAQPDPTPEPPPVSGPKLSGQRPQRRTSQIQNSPSSLISTDGRKFVMPIRVGSRTARSVTRANND